MASGHYFLHTSAVKSDVGMGGWLQTGLFLVFLDPSRLLVAATPSMSQS